MKSKKIAASIFALSLITSSAASNISLTNKSISINSISAYAAQGTEYTYKDWKYTIDPDDNSAHTTAYLGKSKNVTVPDTIDGHKVTRIDRSTFENNKIIESVKFPSGVTSIMGYTFKNATNLKSFTFSDSITAIYAGAFQNTALESITIPSNVKIVERIAFRDCKKLKSVKFENGIETIGVSAFLDSSISEVTIPASIKTIEKSVFMNCNNLKSVTIKGTPTFEEAVFFNCTQLNNINMSTATFENAIKSSALWNCNSLQYLNGQKLFYTDPISGEPFLYDKIKDITLEHTCDLELGGVGYYNDYLTQYIKKKSEFLTKDCKSDIEKVKVLHDWVCNKVEYAYDSDGKPDTSLSVHCDSSVFFGDYTVCDGYARAYTLLLRAAGIEAYCLSSGGHAWTMVKLGDNYFHVDTCHDDGKTIKYNTHFLKSDNDIKKCSSGHSRWWVTNPDNQTFIGGITVYPVARYLYDTDITPTCSYSLGDVNKDGVIDKQDPILIQKYVLGTATLPDPLLADTNCDGKVDLSDGINLLQLYPDCRS